MTINPWKIFGAAAVIGAAMLSPMAAQANDAVKASKSVDVAWAFIPLDVGLEQGLFAKYGIDIEISAMTGDAKLQQALTAGSVDFGLGSGPSMAFAVKGSPVHDVAAYAAEPRNI
jgi:ABC-type nitrate/sulfonate/bicarbonate transport system substrate-binding protein